MGFNSKVFTRMSETNVDIMVIFFSPDVFYTVWSDQAPALYLIPFNVLLDRAQ